jgi:formylglycine-generating enzyme required for sulfatase activity
MSLPFRVGVVLTIGFCVLPSVAEPPSAEPRQVQPVSVLVPVKHFDDSDKKTPPLLKAPFTEKEAKEAQATWAKHLGRKPVEVVDLGGGVMLELVLIPPGTFEMGSPKNEKKRNPAEEDFDAEKQHTVTIAKPFYLANYPVTQEQYEKVVGRNPSWFSKEGGGKDKVQNLDTARFPVETVSCKEAEAFCDKAKNKAPWGKVMLPSEAQWEYACRAGTETSFCFGDVLDGNQANCNGNYPYGTETSGPSLGRSCPVGGDKGKEYKPNQFGL